MHQIKSLVVLSSMTMLIFCFSGCADRPAVEQPKLTDEQIQQIMAQEKKARTPAIKGQPTGEANKNVPDLGF